MYPIVVRPSCILSMQSRATLLTLPLSSSSSVFAASFFFCCFLLLFGFASSSPCLWAGEWERMPNSSMPHLGKIFAAGLHHTLILSDRSQNSQPRLSGYVMAVGANSFSQLGYDTPVPTPNPCAGNFWFGNTGLEYVNHKVIAQFPPPEGPLMRCERLDSVIAVAAGWNFSLALRADGLLTSWGDNTQGQLGQGITASGDNCPRIVATRDPRMVPQGYTEAALNNIIAMDGGKSHAIALRADGSVWAWGSNALGQLGICDNSVASSFYALPVKRVNDIPGQPAVELNNIIAIACGDDFSLALAADGKVWAWGHNNKGQIGNNSFGSDVFCAVQVVGIGGSGFLANVTCIDGGGEHAVAVLANGNVVGWGDNQYGQLALDDQNSPVAYSTYPRLMRSASTTFGNAPAQKYAVAAVASKYITLVLLANGTLRTAGGNERGALGKGSTNFSEKQRHLGAVSGALADGNISTIVCGYNSYFVTQKGQVWSWGDNCNFEQGYGFYGNVFYSEGTQSLVMGGIGVPQVPASAGADILALSSGAGHTFTLRRNGKLFGWGWNYRMQLGTGLYNSTIPLCNQNHSGQPTESLLPQYYYYDASQTWQQWSDSRAIVCALKHTASINFNGDVASWGFDWDERINKGNNLCTGDEEQCVATNSRMLWKKNAEIWHPHQTVQATESGGDEGNNVFALAIASAKGCADDGESLGGGFKYGYYPVYAVTATGRVVGWGMSDPSAQGYNELTEANGNSSYAVYIYKSPNDILDNIVAVAAGPHFGVALDATGHLWKWGTICEYEGIGSPRHRYAYAVMVPDEEINNVKAIAATGFNEEHNFILALKADGNVWAMGYNQFGQCGLSNTGLQPPVVTYQPTFTPIRDCSPSYLGVSKLGNAVKSIEVNPKNGVALRADGTLWIWGSNAYKQFGNCSNNLTEYLPQQANTNPCTEEYRAPLLNISLISSSCDCVFGLDATAALYSAGANSYAVVGHNIQYMRGVVNGTQQDYFDVAPPLTVLRTANHQSGGGAELQQPNTGNTSRGNVSTGNALQGRSIVRKDLKVYPNPAATSSPLWVHTNQSHVSMKVYTLQGMEVCSLKTTTALAQLDLNTQLPELAAGSYLIVASYADGSREQQIFIVQ